MKKALLVVNPVSGKQVAKDSFFEIVVQLSKKYELTVHVTKSASDLVETAKTCRYPTLIICGGDGTLSGAVKGLLENPYREKIKIGYLPCGTANDVAHTLGIPKNMEEAAAYVCQNRAHPHDIGFLGERSFIYTASFGTFAKASYETPQEAKNLLGSCAYVLNGAPELLDLPSYDVRFEYEGGVIENHDLTFCGISNSFYIGGGVVRYPNDPSILADGKLELLLVSRPHSLMDFEQIVEALATKEYNNDMVKLVHTPWIKIASKTPLTFTVDGENGGKFTEVEITCMQNAINIIRK